MTRSRRVLVGCLVCWCAAGAAVAQWSDDPLVNLTVADGAGTQTLPEIGHTSDGGLWVAWFDDSAGSFAVRAQLLDAAGVEQFPHNGILVSDHPQDSALFGWDMIVDSDDHAVIVFSDVRSGGDLDVYAYRVAPDGTEVWGADGVTISDNTDFEPAPRVAEASDGQFVVVWLRDPSVGDGDIRMQRLTRAGAPLLAVGGVPVVAVSGESPGFVEIVPGLDGDVILSWVRDIASFVSPRHVHAGRFDENGAAVWSPGTTVVWDGQSVPIGYFPKLLTDGAGGAWIGWHRSDGTFFNSFVQRLDADGVEQFAHDGVAVSTVSDMHHIDPALARPDLGDAVVVFWNERIANQSQWGIFAQKISAAGARAWGESGVALLPVDATPKSFPRAVPLADGAVAAFTVTSGSDVLTAIRVDGDGTAVWTPASRALSTAASSKSRFPLSRDDAGVLASVWEDSRAATTDLYGQALQPDGSLGAPSQPGDIADLRVDPSALTPGALSLSWGEPCSAGATDVAIYEGILGDFASHVSIDCGDDGHDRVEEVLPGSGDRYYLVVPTGVDAEGSYGRDSAGVERALPGDADRCLTQQDLSGCTL